MRIWRGIFTKGSREDVIARPFGRLVQIDASILPEILAKILGNSTLHSDEIKLTSFSKSREVALRHAGLRGWLLEVEVPVGDVLDVEPFLERMRGSETPGTEPYERISEALEMAHEDQEIFVLEGGSDRIEAVHLVGGFESWEAKK